MTDTDGPTVTTLRRRFNLVSVLDDPFMSSLEHLFHQPIAFLEKKGLNLKQNVSVGSIERMFSDDPTRNVSKFSIDKVYADSTQRMVALWRLARFNPESYDSSLSKKDSSAVFVADVKTIANAWDRLVAVFGREDGLGSEHLWTIIATNDKGCK